MYRLRLESKVTKTLDSLPATVRLRLVHAMTALKTNPRPAGCVKIRGEHASYRIRIGDYRIICEVDDAEELITVWLVGHGREVYRDI